MGRNHIADRSLCRRSLCWRRLADNHFANKYTLPTIFLLLKTLTSRRLNLLKVRFLEIDGENEYTYVYTVYN